MVAAACTGAIRARTRVPARMAHAGTHATRAAVLFVMIVALLYLHGSRHKRRALANVVVVVVQCGK